jgi:hypothetical protein|tara:strand:+ start:42 stop:194 length:153 start_codon:yes stop_codon:yes gene_type:complete
MDIEKIPMTLYYPIYNNETLIKVARIIKPEGELTDEDLEKAKEYIKNGKD